MSAVAGLVLSGETRATAEPSPLTPEAFGARGDGRTNDTAAFAALARFVNAQGGGEIALRRTSYLVGRQVRGQNPHTGYAFEPAPIMNFSGCRRPLVIRGNGARLRCASRLRYGTFDPSTGEPTRHSMPYVRSGELATPYHAMIRAERCSGPIEISDIELDGGLHGLLIGGQYGDVGWQIPAFGIHLVNNRGAERLARVHAHHHALDGIVIDGDDDRVATSKLESVRCEYNGRQGCSIVGGRGYTFDDCTFSHTGKGGLSSPPGAGVDIEAEAGKRVRDLKFVRCRFSNNSGVGLLADSGPGEGATFEDCTFIGTTSWAVWPNKPRFRFFNCTFVGAIAHAYGDPDRSKACEFVHCTFLDNPRLSPTGEVYGGPNPSRPIADLPYNPNVLFDHCTFNLTDRAVLPWTTNVTIFSDCSMHQRAPAQSYPRGTFTGRNVITGNVMLYSARILGEVILNGRRVSQ